MQRFLPILAMSLIALVACKKKENPEEFPVTFNDLELNITAITKVDSIQGFDSSYTEITVRNSKVSRVFEESFDANNQKKFDLEQLFAYNEVKQISGVTFNGAAPQKMDVTYENNERTVKYSFKGNEEDIYDDSTFTYNLPQAESKRPTSATLNYYWVNGPQRVAYRMQDQIIFRYSGNNLSEVVINFEGAVDSIFDNSIDTTRVNYNTAMPIIFAKDTVPMPKQKFRYQAQGRANDLQAYFPIFYNGYETFLLSGSTYPSKIIRDDYQSGSVIRTEYISYVYINDVVSGEIQTINEHRSFTTADVSSQNLRTSYFFNR